MNVISIEHLSTEQGYLIFSIHVVSRAFAGKTSFWISHEQLKKDISALRQIYENMNGLYSIKDTESDDFVMFEFQKYGHVNISGQLGGSYNPQFMHFMLDSDQTVLNDIITIFDKAISMDS
jgi:hypothetical protein